VFAFPKSLPRRIALFGVALFFVGAGVAHFANTAFFVAIVPPYLPAALALVYLSGVCEILGGLGVLLAATRRLAGWGLLALLAAVYPANVHMALHPELFPDLSPAALVARLPLQFVLAAWVWVATHPGPREGEARGPAHRSTGGQP
jgi:uncharacterized membrane protein